VCLVRRQNAKKLLFVIGPHLAAFWLHARPDGENLKSSEEAVTSLKA
jgi:hypothetical protein